MRFPGQTQVRFQAPALLCERGIGLRAANEGDLPFLALLYAQTRAAELAAVPWPDHIRQAFLDSQFALQHRHYVEQYPEADFLVIHQGDLPVGRFYLAREIEDDLIVDIALQPHWCGQGIGAVLIKATLQQAAVHGRGVHLHVLHGNAGARRLYERLGFQVVGDTGSHLHMRCAPAVAGAG